MSTRLRMGHQNQKEFEHQKKKRIEHQMKKELNIENIKD
jgi:hypothetical protein